MEEPGKGWDLARQDPLAQYFKNSVTSPSVGICAKRMYWNTRLCLILFRHELLVFTVWACGDSLMVTGDAALWHLCPCARFTEASVRLSGFHCRSSAATGICELASSIMCPPDNTARRKTLLGIFHFSWLRNENKSVLTLWVTKDCAMPLMTTPALSGCERKGTPVLYNKKINNSKHNLFCFILCYHSWTRIFLTHQYFRIMMIVANRLKRGC